MANVYKKFSYSLRWNALEAIVYQLLFMGHQILLFKVTSTSMYGLIGTLFSGLFLLVNIINIGLEASLGPFYTSLIKNKATFRSILFIQLIPEYCIFFTLFIFSLLQKNNILQKISLGKGLFTILLCTLVLESFKKTIRTFLQLAFLTRRTALIEVGTIVGYISLVWGGYLWGIPINLHLIFGSMLSVSVISTVALAATLFSFYQQLADGEKHVPHNMHLRIVKTRLSAFFNQMSHAIFSSNFLVPFFALRFGLHQAGMLKLLSNTVYSLTSIIQKVFGLSSSALLSHLKEMSIKTKQAAFDYIWTRLHQCIISLVVFSAINYKKLSLLQSDGADDLHWMFILIFIFMNLSENYFLVYEKFFINEEKTHHLLVLSGITIGLSYCLIQFSSLLSPAMILVALLAIRTSSYVVISLTSFYQWQIRPVWKISPSYFAGSLAISIIFFLLLG